MQAINEMTAVFVLTATVASVPIMYLVNVIKDRSRPLRSAVDSVQAIVARWAVWLALILTTIYGLLVGIDRWGLWIMLILLLGPSALFGVMMLVVRIWRKQQ